MNRLADQLTAQETAAMEAMKAGVELDVDDAPDATDDGGRWADDGGAQPRPEAPAADAEPIEPAKAEEPEEATERAESQVPQKALHAERQARREAEKQLADLQRQTRELLEWKREQERRAQQTEQKPAEPEPWPDPVVDPEAYNRRVQAELEKRDQQIRELTEGRQQDTQRTELQQRVATAEREFAAATPDYPDAVRFLAEARGRELALFHGGDQQRVQAALQEEANQIVRAAMAQGKNPAALAYEFAKARGYAPASKAEEPAQTRAVDETKRMETLAKAEQETRSLGNASGGEGGGRLTMQQLAEMPEDEIIRNYKRGDKDVVRALGG